MSLDDERPTLDSVFAAALKIESSEARRAFLDKACRGDSTLLRQVEELLRADRDAGNFLENPAPVPGTVENATTFGGENHLESLPNTIRRQTDNHPILQNDSNRVPLGSDRNEFRYQVHGEIARGGVGMILHGRDVDLQRDLALKVLLEEHKDNPEHVRRFVEEAQISGQLQHPGIVPVFELGRLEDQRPYFSMKLVEGKTLSALLESRENPSDDRGRLLGIFEQVCQTMAYAHSRGVIHRDLKPANIMVGNFGQVQVMDWGLAKVLPASPLTSVSPTETMATSIVPEELRVDTVKGTNGSDSATRLGSVMGTFPYMSPEQAQGKVDQLDERSDVFALGSLLCQILTGQPAYVQDQADLHDMAAGAQLDDCFDRLDACHTEVELIQLAKSCLAPDPNARIRNAGTIASELGSFNESIETRLRKAELDKIAAEVATKEERRRRKIYVGICLLLAAVGAAAIVVAGSIRSLYLEKSKLFAEREQQTRAAEQQRVRADLAAYDAKVSQLASESRAMQDQKPETSVLLAIEAIRLNQQKRDGALSRDVHEALLNVTQSLSGVPLSELSGVSAMQMTERGFVALSGGRVRLFDLNADKSLADASFANELTNVKQFSMNQHGRWLLTVGEKLQRWDLEASAIAPQTIYNDAVLAAAISSDGRWVVAQNNEGIVLWDCDFSTPSSRTLVTDTEVWDRLGVSRDGHHVVLQSGHSECQILTVSDDVETSTPKVRSSRIFTTEISHDGRWIAAGDRDGVRLYQLNASDLLESEIVLPAAVYPQAIRGLRFSQDSRWLFGWHPGFQWISRWDLRSPNASPLVIDGDDSGIHSLAISANGRKLAFGSGSGTVDLLDLAPNQTLNQRKRLKVHDWPVDVIALHPDGHCMATADWNTSVRFWDLSSKTSNSPFVFRGARDQTYVPVATSFDGRWIARVTKTTRSTFGIQAGIVRKGNV